MAARKVWNILPTNYFLITTLRAPYSSRWTQLKNTKLYLRGWVNILKLWSFRCHNVEVLCHIYLILLHDVNSRCRLLLCNHVLVKRHGLIRFKAIVVTSMKFLELQNTLLLPNCIHKKCRDGGLSAFSIDLHQEKRLFMSTSLLLCLTLQALISACLFSTLFCINFLWYWW